MNYTHHIHQALWTFHAAKLRTFLAVLGIVIGTAAVVALINSSQLATHSALEQFKAMGTDLLSVSLHQQKQNHNQQFTLTQWRQLSRNIPGIIEMAPYSTVYQVVHFQGHAFTAPVIGADPTLTTIMSIELDAGRFVSALETFERHCVIGADLAHQFQTHRVGSLLGQQIRIGNAAYTVIGVAREWKENSFFNENINQAIVVPIAGIRLINPHQSINQAVLRLNPHTPIETVLVSIQQYIHQHRPQLKVFTRSARQMIHGMETQQGIFTLLLTSIGAISLLVGGIGIMNVMLVAVSERKQEIGIRKALGASNRDIQHLFLIESTLLALLGGISGVLLGIAITWIIAWINHWSFHLFWFPACIGFGVSVGTGIFFGVYPAYRAAKLDPVHSLRHTA